MALLGNGPSSDLPNPFVGEPSTGELYAGDSPAQFGGRGAETTDPSDLYCSQQRASVRAPT